MKFYIAKYGLAALLPVLLLAQGCQQEEMLLPEEPAKLIARIANETGGTRASYTNVDGKFAWNTGDEIAVYFKGGRYEPIEVIVDSDDPSQGAILSSSVGSKIRDFYAVYPATAAIVPASGETSPKVKLPAAYDVADIVAGTSSLTTNYVETPMVAQNNPGEDLQFYHVGGLVRISVKDVDPATKTVKVTFDKDVTGTFPVDVTDPTQPFIDAETPGSAGDNGKVVTFTVASTDAGVGASVTSLILNVPIPCGTYTSVNVNALDANGVSLFSLTHTDPILIFERHHGKRIAFAEQSIEYIIGGDFEPIVNVDFDGGLGLVTIDFESYGKDEDDNRIPVPFAVEFADSREGPWTRVPPSWLLMGAGIDYSGAVSGKRIEVSLAPQENILPLNSYGIPLDDHTNALRNAPKRTNFDLSTVNPSVAVDQPGGWDNPSTDGSTTANCYVVRAAGTYRFPAVYGNALKKGVANEHAWHATKVDGTWRNVDEPYLTSGEASHLGYFKDHLDGDIKSPYIAEQLRDWHGGLTLARAELLWMDAPGLIKEGSVGYDPGAATSVTDDYIFFEIDEEGITQGNAVIAVFDVDGKIAWSWQIWVTDRDLSQTAEAINGYQLAPVNLGWNDSRKMEEYVRRTCFLRIVQDIPDGAMTDPVEITEDPAPTLYYYGDSPTYQWGRKDPFPGYVGDTRKEVEDKHCYPSKADGNIYYPVFNDPNRVSLGGGIQNPYRNFTADGYYSWSHPSYDNWWNSGLTNTGSDTPGLKVTKTIYDPSPVGFSVAKIEVFLGLTSHETTGMNASNTPWREVGEMGEDAWCGRTYNDLWFPARPGTDANTHYVANGLYRNRGEFGSRYMRFSRDVIICSNADNNGSNPVRCMLEEE